MQFTFGDKGEVYLLDESVLPVTQKKKGERGKVASALGLNMDTQIIIQFAHIQTEGIYELHALWRHDSVILQGAK